MSAASAVDRYAVIGHPVAHSLSPRIHAEFAHETGQRVRYERIEAPLDGFASTLAAFAQGGGKGCNVTLPFKEEAFALAITRSPRAQAAGACNTLAWMQGRLHGDNTDGAGLCRDLERNLGWPVAGRRILVLGAGGAARGIIGPLAEAGAAALVVANRTHSRAAALASRFAALGSVSALALDALDGEAFDIVINATSGAMTSEDPSTLTWPRLDFGRGPRACDLAYGPAALPFLRWAEANGAVQVADGLGMLVEQAAESFFVWRDVRPDTRRVLASLRAA